MSADPDARAYVIKNRKRVDVTEEVKTVLDCLSSSLDWGSGFLCADDIEAWGKVAGALEMDVKGIPEQVVQMRKDEAEWAERQEEQAKRSAAALMQLPDKERWVHEARLPTGLVLVRMEADAGEPVSWEPDYEISKIEWWVNKGRGFERAEQSLA